MLPVGARTDRPDYDYLDALTLEVYPASVAETRTITVTTPDGREATFAVEHRGADATVTSSLSDGWSLRVAGSHSVPAADGRAQSTTGA